MSCMQLAIFSYYASASQWKRLVQLPVHHPSRFQTCSSSIMAIKGPVQTKSMFISIDQLPKMIEFHTIIVHNYSSVDFILIFE